MFWFLLSTQVMFVRVTGPQLALKAQPIRSGKPLELSSFSCRLFALPLRQWSSHCSHHCSTVGIPISCRHQHVHSPSEGVFNLSMDEGSAQGSALSSPSDASGGIKTQGSISTRHCTALASARYGLRLSEYHGSAQRTLFSCSSLGTVTESTSTLPVGGGARATKPSMRWARVSCVTRRQWASAQRCGGRGSPDSEVGQ
jgi:hypothetical protein